jgi:hypothetical protein
MARHSLVRSARGLILCSAIGAVLGACGSSVHTYSAKTSYEDGYDVIASLSEGQKAQGPLGLAAECSRFAALGLRLSQDRKAPWVEGCSAALVHAHYVQVTVPGSN